MAQSPRPRARFSSRIAALVLLAAAPDGPRRVRPLITPPRQPAESRSSVYAISCGMAAAAVPSALACLLIGGAAMRQSNTRRLS